MNQILSYNNILNIGKRNKKTWQFSVSLNATRTQISTQHEKQSEKNQIKANWEKNVCNVNSGLLSAGGPRELWVWRRPLAPPLLPERHDRRGHRWHALRHVHRSRTAAEVSARPVVSRRPAGRPCLPSRLLLQGSLCVGRVLGLFSGSHQEEAYVRWSSKFPTKKSHVFVLLVIELGIYF